MHALKRILIKKASFWRILIQNASLEDLTTISFLEALTEQNIFGRFSQNKHFRGNDK